MATVSESTRRALLRGVRAADVRRGLRKAGPTPAGVVVNSLALLTCLAVLSIVAFRVLYILFEGVL